MKKCGRTTARNTTRLILTLGAVAGIYLYLKYKNIQMCGEALMAGLLLAVIFKSTYTKYKYKKYLLSSMTDVDKMTGEEFEEFLAAHFKDSGYKVKFTPMTSDYGADLIIKKHGEKTAVQAKRWKTVVGIEAVQQAAGALRYYGADYAVVITNSTYTKNAEALARANDIQLWDRKDLRNFIGTEKYALNAEAIWW